MVGHDICSGLPVLSGLSGFIRDLPYCRIFPGFVNMQNLIVTCIIILSVCILYRDGASYALKYRIRSSLFRLFTWMNAEGLAKKMNPDQLKNNLPDCCGCSKCPPQKENVHPIRIVKKTDMDK